MWEKSYHSPERPALLPVSYQWQEYPPEPRVLQAFHSNG